MRIYYSFLIILCAVLLALLPFTGAVHSLLTDLREDTFTVDTSGGTTNTTVQLFKTLYDGDTSSIALASHDSDDIPLFHSYNATTRSLAITGFAANTTRSVDVTYDVDAIGNTYFATALTTVTYLWLIIIGLFAIGSLVWLWAGPVKERLSRA